MPSLIGTTVTANYLKAAPSTQFGTRALKFLTFTMGNGGDSDVDLTRASATGGAYAGTYTDSDSYLSRLVRAVQQFDEIYAVGTPTATTVTVVVADDTQNSADSGNTQNGGYGLLEAAVVAAMGAGNKADNTAYNGNCTVAALNLSGVTLA